MNHKTEKCPKILVIGDLIVDEYLSGSTNRISPEGPIPIVEIEDSFFRLGGAANVASNLKTLGADVDLISVIGNDENSVRLKKLLLDKNISDTMLVNEEFRTTPLKTRVIAANQQVLRFDREKLKYIDTETEKQVISKILSSISKYKVIVISDYGKGLMTNNLTRTVIKIANDSNVKVIVDPKGSDYSKYSNSYLITPNKKEAALASDTNIKDEESLKKSLIKLKNNLNLSYAFITLSEDGIALYDNDLEIFPTHLNEVYDVTGAGDTVISVLSFMISCGKSIRDSIFCANVAAGIAITKLGSASISLQEIIDSKENSKTIDRKYKNNKKIISLVNDLKKKGKKIVFTNGCFDIIHAGHVKYLEEAKSFGDFLFVGVNSDESIRKIKGESRPINTLIDRISVLSGLHAVDYLCSFKEETPLELIKNVKPDILVKGMDYSIDEVVGGKYSKEVKLVELADGKSTSNIIKKIKDL